MHLHRSSTPNQPRLPTTGSFSLPTTSVSATPARSHSAQPTPAPLAANCKSAIPPPQLAAHSLAAQQASLLTHRKLNRSMCNLNGTLPPIKSLELSAMVYG